MHKARYVVFNWFAHGDDKTHAPILRANGDGTDPVQLTDGKSQFFCVCSPDPSTKNIDEAARDRENESRDRRG